MDLIIMIAPHPALPFLGFALVEFSYAGTDGCLLSYLELGRSLAPF